jgi:hypothetical protein
MKLALASVIVLTASVTSSAQAAKLSKCASSVGEPGHCFEPNHTVRFWAIKFFKDPLDTR